MFEPKEPVVLQDEFVIPRGEYCWLKSYAKLVPSYRIASVVFFFANYPLNVGTRSFIWCATLYTYALVFYIGKNLHFLMNLAEVKAFFLRGEEYDHQSSHISNILKISTESLIQ